MTRPTGCAPHRRSLVAFVDRGEIGPRTDAALAHLDACPGCSAEMETIALAVVALRRIGREAAIAEPPTDAWDRLRQRIERPRVAVWQARATLAGVAVAAGLVGILVGPSTMTLPRVVYLQEVGTSPAAFDAIRLAEVRAENAVIDRQRATRLALPASAWPAAAPAPSAAESGWTGPDGIGVVDTDRAAAPARSSWTAARRRRRCDRTLDETASGIGDRRCAG